MNTIEKIKAEIMRMHQEAVLAAIGKETDWLRSRIGTLVDVLDIIGSLPAETSGDLEEEIRDWCGKYTPEIREYIQSTAYHFANWQKEQMMKDAVEGEVVSLIPERNYVKVERESIAKAISGFKEGDKVKIIIVKEDGQ